MAMGWGKRARLFALRFWQPTSACLTCMPGSLANVANPAHWKIALETGLATGVLVLLISFTPLAAAFGDRYRNALLVAVLTAIGDSYAHATRGEFSWIESVVTGVVSGMLALAVGTLFEDRGRRMRALWRR